MSESDIHVNEMSMRYYKMASHESEETAKSDGITWCEMMSNDINFDIFI